MRRVYKISLGLIVLSLIIIGSIGWGGYETSVKVKGWVEAPGWKTQYNLPQSAIDILMNEKEFRLVKPTKSVDGAVKLTPNDLLHTSQVWSNPMDYRPFRIIVTAGKERQIYTFFSPQHIYNSVGRGYEPDKRLQQLLQQAIYRMTQQVGFGQLASWAEVKQDFPKFTYAYITDLESRRRFRVQNRAGSSHADVQPVTAADTAIMKEIYDGQWSWRRRAVVVEIDKKTYAGSMNGMPHGAGAIRGNKFNGHFCLHFLDSLTHVKSIDPSHQLMVWKASGHLPLLLGKLDQEALAVSLISVLKQQDLAMLSLMLDRPFTKKEKNKLKKISVINLERYNQVVNGMELEVKYYLEGISEPIRKKLVLPIKASKAQGFKAGANEFMQIL